MQHVLKFNSDGVALSRTSYVVPISIVTQGLVYVTTNSAFGEADLYRISATIDNGEIVGDPVIADPAITVAVSLEVDSVSVPGGVVAEEQGSSAVVKLIVTSSNGFSGVHALPISTPTNPLGNLRLTFTDGTAEHTANLSAAVGEYSMDAVRVEEYLSAQHTDYDFAVTGNAKVIIYPSS